MAAGKADRTRRAVPRCWRRPATARPKAVTTRSPRRAARHARIGATVRAASCPAAAGAAMRRYARPRDRAPRWATSAIRKVSPDATAPRGVQTARGHPGEVAARRHSRMTACSQNGTPSATDAAQAMQTRAFRAACIPIRTPAVAAADDGRPAPELAAGIARRKARSRSASASALPNAPDIATTRGGATAPSLPCSSAAPSAGPRWRRSPMGAGRADSRWRRRSPHGRRMRRSRLALHYGVRVDQSRCAQQMSATSVMRQVGIYFAARR